MWRVAEDAAAIVDTACLSSKDTDEVALVVNDDLKDNGKVALAVDELLDTLGQGEHGGMGAVHDPNTVGQAHAADADDHLLQDGKTDQMFGQDILNCWAHILDSFSGCGLVHAEPIGNGAKTAESGHLPDDDGHPLLQNEEWPHADVQVHDM
ncbi:hypothetical protein Y1Q_0005263 [Alligator mississippiensis]|uniref:Uncharacterized protein n=1 Tax=Alligator mississippiensis TaxID=8496 RepID=A0A151MT72_ALLMI|nr:hypothetical protein Y1Q_0005263 [Alligator mississippiensis]